MKVKNKKSKHIPWIINQKERRIYLSDILISDKFDLRAKKITRDIDSYFQPTKKTKHS